MRALCQPPTTKTVDEEQNFALQQPVQIMGVLHAL